MSNETTNSKRPFAICTLLSLVAYGLALFANIVGEKTYSHINFDGYSNYKSKSYSYSAFDDYLTPTIIAIIAIALLVFFLVKYIKDRYGPFSMLLNLIVTIAPVVIVLYARFGYTGNHDGFGYNGEFVSHGTSYSLTFWGVAAIVLSLISTFVIFINGLVRTQNAMKPDAQTAEQLKNNSNPDDFSF